MTQRLHQFPEQSEAKMEPMVDVVFLLLVFFLFTFQVRLMEQPIDISVPKPTKSMPPPESKPWKVKLLARADGALESIMLGDEEFASITELESALTERLARGDSTDDRVLLEPAGQIQYEHVMHAAVAIRRSGGKVGLLAADNSQIKPTPGEVP